MRRWVHIATAALVLALAPAASTMAQDAPADSQSIDLDQLFAQLRVAPDEPAAREIADRIWRIWTTPDDPVLAARVRDIITGGGFAGPAAQLPQINQLIEDYPDYPEGYNLRATAGFLRGDYANALLDIEETLKREPRHFGALAGRVLIFHTQGKFDEARKALLEALEIHPFLPERSLFPDLVETPINI